MSDRPIFLRFGESHELYVRRVGVSVEVVGSLPEKMTPDEAEAVADALQHAAFRARITALQQTDGTLIE
jgi:hypothetical protein